MIAVIFGIVILSACVIAVLAVLWRDECSASTEWKKVYHASEARCQKLEREKRLLSTEFLAAADLLERQQRADTTTTWDVHA